MARSSFEANLHRSYPVLFPRAEQCEEPHPLIGCGAGWFLLVEMLCEQIQDLVDEKNLPQPTICSIKEKFGVMRVRCNEACEPVMILVSAAERASSHFCEVCGSFGLTQKTSHGWVKTLCSGCSAVAASDLHRD